MSRTWANVVICSKSIKRKVVRLISLDSEEQLEIKGFNVIPGMKVCYNCTVKSSYTNKTVSEFNEGKVNMEIDTEFEEAFIREQIPNKQLNSSLISFGESICSMTWSYIAPLCFSLLNISFETLEESVVNV